MRFILTLMVVGTTMAIQSPNLGQSGFVTTMIEFAPGDNTCQTPVALTYQPTGVCIAASQVPTNVANVFTYPSVTPVTQTPGTLSTTTAKYQSYIYSVSAAGAVFISYYTDSFCSNLVTATIPGGTVTQSAGDTPVVATLPTGQTGCTLASSQGVTVTSSTSAGVTTVTGNAIGNTPSNNGGGWEYYTTPFTFTATAPISVAAGGYASLAVGSVPLSIMNTYANSVGSATGMTASCAGLPTQVTIQNIALTQMAPFTSGNTCAKTACAAATFYGQPNGAASIAAGISPSVSNTNTISVMSQNTCTLPTTSANQGYYLRNFYTVRFFYIPSFFFKD